MISFKKRNETLDFSRAVNICHGIWWVGFQDSEGLRCNPYLIVEGDEAVLIDGGSRPDFPVVMMKVLETGLNPKNISALIYDHHDPDLCGSIPNLEEMIANPDLVLISSGFSNVFIRHYGSMSKFVNVADIGNKFTFKTGRTLEFIDTPYCHTRGSFVVFDSQSKVLFSADIFGTYQNDLELFYTFPPDCGKENACESCREKDKCELPGYLDFHRTVMPSSKAVRHSMKRLKELPFELVAPQHGSILDRHSADILIEKLASLDDIGIDQIFHGE